MRSSRMYEGQRGVVLVTVLILAILIGGFCMVSLLVSTTESRASYLSIQHTKALFVAQSGLESEIYQLKKLQSTGTDPLVAVDAMEGTTVIENQVLTLDNMSVGEYSVRITSVEAVGTSGRDVTIESTGWVPSASADNAHRRVIRAVVRMSLGRSNVFNYVYFINNWGWYYGNTIYANGNVRSNGQFDGGGYRATVNPLPMYDKVEGSDFQDKVGEGGLYSGWDIVNAQNMKGISGNWTKRDAEEGLCDPEDVGTSKYQHPFTEQIEMPNLTDMSVYEKLATEKKSSIRVGRTVVCDGIVGDDKSEKPNLYLYGTRRKPIVLNGPVVVRGNVIIHGYVEGQGAIYAGGNIYVPGDLKYKNPAQAFPSKKTEEALEDWVKKSTDADSLGLFAREHIIAGDYTDRMWQRYVSRWVNDSRNGSDEDAGDDKIPNTYVGRDGIRGTADDDVLEKDGKWTTELYSEADKKLGLIPEGSEVGDPVPGTGEDIDGDGKYDPTTKMSEFSLPRRDFVINPGRWEGVCPRGRRNRVYKYSQIATSRIKQLDAAFYTNHTFAMLTTERGNTTFNGSLVCRNEAIVYCSRRLIMNYDLRLLDGGESFGFYLPQTWQAIEVLVWGVDENAGEDEDDDLATDVLGLKKKRGRNPGRGRGRGRGLASPF